MIRVHVICEGQTEEEFVRHVLYPALLERNVILLPSCIGKVGHKGGNVNLARLELDVRERLLKEKQCFCTTLFDYYGLPSNFPGKAQGNSLQNITDKQRFITEELSKWARENLDGNAASRFLPYVQMYEFEGLLFSDPEALAKTLDQGLAEQLMTIRDKFKSPEEINDSPNTAPSKRLIGLYPQYDKPIHGSLAALEVGLDIIRQQCRLFDGWLTQIENLPSLQGC
ncbi:DUF4276 family protein [Methylomonas sp. YC3]